MNDTATVYEVFQVEVVFTFYFLYMLILLIGLPGNVLTCVVILVRKSMRRSIHYYTFNLAICDLLILFFYIPTQLAYIKAQMTWTMGLAMCKASYFVLPIALNCTIGTLLAISIDRTRGLIQPFKWRSDSRRMAKITLPIIWVISLILSIPLFIVPQLYTHEDGMVTCYEVWPNEKDPEKYWIVMFAISFAMPLLVIFILHIVMLVVLMKETNIRNRQHNREILKMTIAVVLVFTVCTGFQHVYFFVSTYVGITLPMEKLALLYCFGNFVVTLQAALNPIIYGTLRQDFKKAFKHILYKLMLTLKLHQDMYEEKTFVSTCGVTTFHDMLSTGYDEIKWQGDENRNIFKMADGNGKLEFNDSDVCTDDELDKHKSQENLVKTTELNVTRVTTKKAKPRVHFDQCVHVRVSMKIDSMEKISQKVYEALPYLRETML